MTNGHLRGSSHLEK